MKIKVVSLNLLYGGELMPGILDFLKQENPDLLICQEARNGSGSLPENYRSIEVLQKHFNFPAYKFLPMFIDTDHGGVDFGVATFARFPVTKEASWFIVGEYGEALLSDPTSPATVPRVLQHVTLDSPVGELNVFNLHGVWDLDGDNFSPQRQKMGDVILAAIKGKSNVILAGDSNAKPTNKALRDIEQHLVSVFGDELTTSFNMKRKDNPGYATAVVDVAFVSPNIRVLSKSCPNVDISDHLPLAFTLEIPK